MAWTAALYRIPFAVADGATSPADIKALIESGDGELLAVQTKEGDGGFLNLSNDGFPAGPGDLFVAVATEGIIGDGVTGIRSDSVYECDTKSDGAPAETSYYKGYYKFPYYYLP